MPPSAEQLRERLVFAKRGATDDGYGNETGDWVDQFTQPASIIPRRYGDEAITAARLAGRAIAVIIVRASSVTAEITTNWRATNPRNGDVWNVKSPPLQMPDKRGFLEMLCESTD